MAALMYKNSNVNKNRNDIATMWPTCHVLAAKKATTKKNRKARPRTINPITESAFDEGLEMRLQFERNSFGHTNLHDKLGEMVGQRSDL